MDRFDGSCGPRSIISPVLQLERRAVLGHARAQPAFFSASVPVLEPCTTNIPITGSAGAENITDVGVHRLESKTLLTIAAPGCFHIIDDESDERQSIPTSSYSSHDVLGILGDFVVMKDRISAQVRAAHIRDVLRGTSVSTNFGVNPGRVACEFSPVGLFLGHGYEDEFWVVQQSSTVSKRSGTQWITSYVDGLQTQKFALKRNKSLSVNFPVTAMHRTGQHHLLCADTGKTVTLWDVRHTKTSVNEIDVPSPVLSITTCGPHNRSIAMVGSSTISFTNMQELTSGSTTIQRERALDFGGVAATSQRFRRIVALGQRDALFTMHVAKDWDGFFGATSLMDMDSDEPVKLLHQESPSLLCAATNKERAAFVLADDTEATLNVVHS